MKGSSNDNGKISDSGYTNTCVSQSLESSDSSLSRNSNRSESSGYCGGNPSTFDSSNYALPQPISRRKEHNKKKFKTATTTSFGNIDPNAGTQLNTGRPNNVGTYETNRSSCDFTNNCKKSEEVAGVELIDDKGLGEHNGDSNSTESDGGVGTINKTLEDTTSNANVGFGAVISMKKGLIIDATSSLGTALGYTRESWVDRAFIDFVHPKDKQSFANHLAKNVARSYGHNRDKDLSGRQESLFCSLRSNDEAIPMMECGSDERNSPHDNLYQPFYLTTSVKFFRKGTIDEKPRTMFLIVKAEPIVPVYKAPEEIIMSAIFSTRHDTSCNLTDVDLNVVQYFGYMPQDMIGRSLFDFYHPEDLPFMKDVYETVVKMAGTPFRSRPYRFAAQNGDYVLLDTEWSSFVNPWWGKLEFVVGHHRVIRGPANPNVFQSADDCQRIMLSNISEEIFKESNIIQSEIRALLNEKIQRTEDSEEFEITSRSKDLDAFVENLLLEIESPAPESKERFTTDDRSFVEQDTVIFDAILPHREYYDSKTSSETPPSYNELNYNEKITRFFDSKLHVTTAYGSDEDNVNPSLSNNENAGKTSSHLTETKDTTLSAENLSSGSNNRTSYDSRDDSDNSCGALNTTPNESLKISKLTESVLNIHNREMEKLFVRQHNERQCTIRINNKHNKDTTTLNDTNDKSNEQRKSRGSKRRSTGVCEGKLSKVPKYNEKIPTSTVVPVPAMTETPRKIDNKSSIIGESRQNTNILPSSDASPQKSSQIYIQTISTEIPRTSTCSGLRPPRPIYYVPLPRIREDFEYRLVPQISRQSLPVGQLQQANYVSYAVANYPPIMTMLRPIVMTEPVPINRETPQLISELAQSEKSADRNKRPASQATSIKAETGSTMAMSENSKKPLSYAEYFSSCVSIDGGCSSLLPINTRCEANTSSQFESSSDDSSDSSFYGSFLSQSSDSSYKSNTKIVEYASQKTLWKPIIRHMNNDRKRLDILGKGPLWQEGVKMSDELIYRYQLTPKPLNEVLEADMTALKKLNQPQLINKQLKQLYSDMGIDEAGFAAKLVLCDADAFTHSESSCSSGNKPRNIVREVREM